MAEDRRLGRLEVLGAWLGVWTPPNGDRVAWFKDPDGNVLSISQHAGTAAP